MNVLYVASSALIGGGNRSLLILARGLVKRGHGVTVAIPSPGPLANACEDASIPGVCLEYGTLAWRTPLDSGRALRRWSELIRGCRPTLVHVNDLASARLVSLPAVGAGRPVVCHVRYPADRAFVRWNLRGLPKPQVFLYNSHALMDEMLRIIGPMTPRARHALVHNAVDLSCFTPARGLGDIPRVGIVANLVPVKGHLDFLAMASRLRRDNVRAQFWIIGDDIHGTGYRAVLEDKVRQLHLDEDVTFVGFRDDVPQLLQQLTVLVCSSHVEPFGRCVIEAMAAGVAVVATRVGGLPEIVEDNTTGLLVPPRQPDALAAAVARLLREPDVRRELTVAARERVVSRFGADEHVERVLALYRDCTDQVKRGGWRSSGRNAPHSRPSGQVQDATRSKP